MSLFGQARRFRATPRLDALARGPVPRSRLSAPAGGTRCPRCHRTAPHTGGCALCSPEKLQQRLARVKSRLHRRAAMDNRPDCPGEQRDLFVEPRRPNVRARFVLYPGYDLDNRYHSANDLALAYGISVFDCQAVYLDILTAGPARLLRDHADILGHLPQLPVRSLGDYAEHLHAEISRCAVDSGTSPR